jgi:hypothetical protein
LTQARSAAAGVIRLPSADADDEAKESFQKQLLGQETRCEAKFGQCQHKGNNK